jgi:hypothetical protein
MKKITKLLLLASVAVGLILVSPSQKVKAVAANFTGSVYRVYNPNSGEHVYTMDRNEVSSLESLGWHYEGELGTSYYGEKYAPIYKGIPVYRLYNAAMGQHLYTLNTNEVKENAKYGWKNEGIVFYSSNVVNFYYTNVYRLYNPNSGQHFYTKNKDEANGLVKLGWHDEGVAFMFTTFYDTPAGGVSAT